MKRFTEAIDFRTKPSMLCSVLSTITAAVYLYTRNGFEDHSIYVFKIAGTSFFIFLSPFIFKKFLKKFDLNPLIFSVISYCLISVLGFFITPLIGWVVSIIGCVLFLYYLILIFFSIKKSDKFLIIIYGAFSLLLSAWIIANCWAKLTLNPLYLENAVAGVLGWGGWNGTDTLYHVTLSQMIKTYFVPSTGINGLPFAPYHFGHHLLLAGLSGTLDVPMLILYNASYAILIVPFLLHCIFQFVFQLRDIVNNKTYTYSGVAIILIISFYFLELIKHRYSGGGLGNTFLLSESTTASIIFLIFCFSVIQFYWSHKGTMGSHVNSLFIFLLIPLSIFFLGLTKISTFFIFEGVLMYLWLRFKTYTDLRFIFFFVINGAIVAVILYLTMESLPFGLRTLSKPTIDSTEIGGSIFYKEVDLIAFFLLFCYAIAVVVITFVRYKINSLTSLKQCITSGKTLPVEIIIMTCIMGLLPTFFLRLYAANYMYFLVVQSIISIVFISAYVTDDQFQWINRKKIPFKIILMALLLLAFNYVSISIRKDLKDQFFYFDSQTRVELTNPHIVEYPPGQFRYLAKFISVRKETNLDTLKTNPYFKVINGLKTLDALSVSEKRISMIYVDLAQIPLPKVKSRTIKVWIDYSVVNDRWMMMCYDLPLLVPALTGIAMVDGMPCNCGSLSGHGFVHYHDRVGCKEHIINEEILEEVRAKGFKQLFYFDDTAFEFKKIALSKL